MLRAPWTDDQVAKLNAYQQSGYMHPFTCPNHAQPDHAQHGDLVATPDGWVCTACAYRQDWCHEFMTKPVFTAEEYQRLVVDAQGRNLGPQFGDWIGLSHEPTDR